MADPEKTSEGLEIPEYHGLQLTKHDLTLCFPELIQYDVSLGLPERDTAVDAPEHDDAENAPEWDAAGNAPELDIRREPLEVTAVSIRYAERPNGLTDTCAEKFLACPRTVSRERPSIVVRSISRLQSSNGWNHLGPLEKDFPRASSDLVYYHCICYRNWRRHWCRPQSRQWPRR